MRNSLSEPKRLFSLPLVGLFALILTLAACGSGSEEVDAGSGGDDAETSEDSSSEDTADQEGAPDDGDTDDGDTADGDTGDESTDDGGDYVITSAQADLISAQPAAIDEIRTIDDQTIGIRYQNGSEPCALANVSVTESDTEVQVALETGIHPNAAAMSCIAQVLGYEIQVTLDAPIADRTIVAVEA